MSVKTWNCPKCYEAFIVDGDATRDTCPWCQAAVEQTGDGLKVASEPTPGADTPKPAPEQPPTGLAGAQTWWPFELGS